MRATNRKAKFDYEIIETLEAGMVLTGSEVKSIKKGHVNLTGSRVVFDKGGTHFGGQAYIIGMSVPLYEHTQDENYDPERRKKLLLSRRQIEYLASKKESEGLTVIGVSVYNKGSLIKIEIGLARGKKNREKREKIKKRIMDRKLARLLKN
jgi:SsrA-binding protein